MAAGNLLVIVAATGELHHPGLRRDERGVVLGRECLLRFQTLPDLLAFVRLYALRGALDGILHAVEVQALLAEPVGSDFALRLPVQGSREVDALQDAARLAGGQLFVGGGRSFVAYREAEAPFGYDLLGGEEPARGLVLHRPAGALRYPELRRLDLAELVFSLPLVRSFEPPADEALMVQAPAGLYQAVSRYLLRHGQGVEAALLDASGERPVPGRQRFCVFRVKKLSRIGLGLLLQVPGLRLLRQVVDNVLVPLGWRHPLPLESMSGLAPQAALLLLQESGQPPLDLGALSFQPHLPPVALGVSGAPLAARPVEEQPQRFGLSVSLVPNGRKEPATGLLIPAAQHELLRRILQGLPSSVLEGCSLAAGSDVAVVLGQSDVLRSIPLGILLKARTERLYLPVGTSLLPDPPPDALGRMFVGAPEGEYIVLTPQEAYHFPAKALLPLSRLLVARFYARRMQLLTHPPEPSSVEFQPTLAQRLSRRLLEGETEE
jgi:hypothetical protein